MAELFEARRPKDCAIIAEMSGRVEFGKDYKNKRRIKITPEDEGETVEFLIPKGKHISVHDGDFVVKGEYIIDGSTLIRTTSFASWGSRRWPNTSSTRSRRSIACRACRSTTSTSR